MLDKKPTPKESTAASSAQKSALGGKATKPDDFRPIGAPNAQAPAVAPAPNAQPAGRATHGTFDEDPVAAAHRATITNARQQLKTLVTNIDQRADSLRRLLDSLDTPEGKAEAERQGFSPEVAREATEALDAVIEKYKPRQQAAATPAIKKG